MNNYRYSLDNTKPNKLFTCPQCQRKSLKMYVDWQENAYLTGAGRCNREIKCGYHVPPKCLGIENKVFKRVEPIEKPVPSTLPKEWVEKCRGKNLAKSNLFEWIGSELGYHETAIVFQKYHVGTCMYYENGTVFWQILENGNVRAGKLMGYNKEGKRIKKPHCQIQWVHIAQKVPYFTLGQVYFGTHLLREYPVKDIILVESEKTALILSIIFPSLLVLATGGLQNLHPNTYNLGNRKVIAVPDIGAWVKWEKKAQLLRNIGANIVVSDYLEHLFVVHPDDMDAYNEHIGKDIADFWHILRLENYGRDFLTHLESCQ